MQPEPWPEVVRSMGCTDPIPSPSPDHRFESDRSSVSTSSSVQDLIDLGVPGITTMADTAGSHKKINLSSLQG